MSVSKKMMGDPEIVKKVLWEYLESPDKPIIKEVATRTGATFHTVAAILHLHVPEDVFKAQAALRYSRALLRTPHYMLGRTGEKHHNWKGLCSDNKGHWTQKFEGVRYFIHRIVFAQALGMHPSQLDPKWTVHHIDGDTANNNIDNLALCTRSGHGKLHRRWKALALSPLWELYKSSILR